MLGMAAARQAAPSGNQMVAALEAQRDELVAAAFDAIRARIPVYRDADPALAEDVLGHIRAHHDLLCAVLRRGRPAEPRDFRFVARHAARRARRGVALADFLEAFRCYHNVVWDAMSEAARGGSVSTEEALATAGAVLRYVDLAATESSTAFLEAQQLLIADSDRVRRDLLEDLLAGRGPESAAGLVAAREAGLDEDACCLVVAALPTAAPEEESALRRAANALAAAIRDRRTAPLAVTRHGEIVLVRGVAADQRPALVAPLERACADPGARPLALAVGVSTVQRGIGGLGDAYREASLAVRRVAANGGVLSLADLTPFEYLMMRGDAVARRMIAPEIERFVAEDRARGGTLIRTLIAYVDADLNAKAAAEALLIHVNTVHHRLGRIAERTGCDLRRLSDVIDLLIAIRLTDGPPRDG
jgi:PucR-like helix-turn-helix protein/diguanylate cyclase with GGDEF domain